MKTSSGPFAKCIFRYLIILLSAILLIECGDSSGGKITQTANDITPPSEIKLTDSTAGWVTINLNWEEPAENDFSEVRINWSPDGAQGVALGKGTTSYSLPGLINGNEYTVTIKTADSSGNESAGISFRVTLYPSEKPLHFIYQPEDLAAINDNVANLDDYYILMDDVDLNSYSSGEGWVPVGNNTNRFSGVFDGNRHVINNLLINRTGQDYQGLFGYTSAGSLIKNTGIEAVNVKGKNYTGGLAGRNTSGVISHCYVTGTISGANYAGGLVGHNTGSILFCFSDITINPAYNNAGGIAGYSGTDTARIENCFSTGSIGIYSYAGGIVGTNDFGSVINCYAEVDVTSIAESTVYPHVGGLIGSFSGKLNNCYSTGKITSVSLVYSGGFIGSHVSGSVTDCFYDKDTAGRSDTGKGEPRTTLEMKTKSTYPGAAWNFDLVWNIDVSVNSGYPFLRNAVNPF